MTLDELVEKIIKETQEPRTEVRPWGRFFIAHHNNPQVHAMNVRSNIKALVDSYLRDQLKS